MKAALFSTTRYTGPTKSGWPVAVDAYEPDIAADSMDATLENFRLADEVGFDWVTVAEHHYAPMSLNPNPMVMAGAMTQVVKRAKIALLGPNIPINNPIRVAEEFAMLDTMTRGRVVAGLMRGTGNEYVTYNVNPAESRDRFKEAVELIRAAWTETQPFGWQGRHFQYRTISIWPRPVQKPHPPIYVSASSPESGEYAAENKLGIGFAFTSAPQAGKASAYYQDQCAKHGWIPTGDDIVFRMGFHIADTDEEAMQDLLQGPGRGAARIGVSVSNKAVESAVKDAGYYGRDVEGQRSRLFARGELEDRIETGQVLCGGPDTVISQIKRLKETVGCGVLDLTLGANLGDKTKKSIRLMGESILPQIRDL